MHWAWTGDPFHISLPIPSLLWLLFSWDIFFHPFTFNLFFPLNFKCVSCRQRIVRSVFLSIQPICLLIGEFNPSAFRLLLMRRDLFLSFCSLVFTCRIAFWSLTFCIPLLCLVNFLFLEKEMATHSSILAWRIPWTEEPGGLQSTGLQRVGHDWVTSLSLSLTFCSEMFKFFFNFFLSIFYS